MRYSTIIFIIFLVFITGLLGYNYVEKPFGTITVPEPSVAPQPSPETTSFDQLTARQRIALVIAAPITVEKSGEVDQGQQQWILTNQPGMVTLFGDKISTSSAIKAVADIGAVYRPLVAVDHEGGTVQRLNGPGFTALPSWQKLCLESVAERKELLGNSAHELQTVGIDVVFGPVVDLTASRSALGTRTCGSSAELVAQRSREYIEAFVQEGILPVVKHFPGIGSLRQDLHYHAVATETNEAELLVYDYILSNHPALGVMVAHVSLGELDGEVCSLSRQCVSGLKNVFTKVTVFTDALDMKSAEGVAATSSAAISTVADRAVAAIKAGNDVLVFGRDTSNQELDQVQAALLREYEENIESRTMIDAAAKKVFILRNEKQQ